MLFIVVQVGLEPWRRKRLVRGFEEKVREAVKEVQQVDNSAVIQLGESVVEPHRERESVMIVEKAEEPVEQDEQEVAGVLEDIVQRKYEEKDILISAASGLVIGGLVTTLATWIISR